MAPPNEKRGADSSVASFLRSTRRSSSMTASQNPPFLSLRKRLLQCPPGRLPRSAVASATVKTGGCEAEYGMATGGVVNVLTESGTNAFHGDAFGYIRPQTFESSYKQLQTPNGTVKITAQAMDAAGNTGTSPPVSVTVSNTAPPPPMMPPPMMPPPGY